jgi:membrane protein DedA with SNARE-associated domain
VPAWLLDLFTKYGYGAVVVGVLLEGAGVPIPGETMLLAGAVLAHSGRLSLPLVVLSAICGGLAGDNLGFFIGRRGGRWIVERYGAPLGLTPERMAEFDRFFERHGPRTIFVARFVTGLRVVCAVLAGGSGISWPIFAIYNAAGVATWSVAIGLVGYLVGESWSRLERLVGTTGLVLLAGAILVGGFLIFRARRAHTSS